MTITQQTVPSNTVKGWTITGKDNLSFASLTMEHAEFKLPMESRLEDMVIPGLLFQPQDVASVNDFVMSAKDVIVASYPRSGTTWISEIVYNLTRGVNDPDVHLPQAERVRFLEFELKDGRTGSEGKSPALYKTHLPAHMLQRQIRDDETKVVVVIRNPRDVLVSLYHFYCSNRVLGPFPGDWSDFFKLFLADHLVYGDWFKHVAAYVSLARRHNVHVVVYEDAVANLHETVTSLAAFLGRCDITSNDIDVICARTKFSAMRRHRECIMGKMLSQLFVHDDFIRKGRVGEWEKYFTNEQESEIMDKYGDCLANIGLDFQYTS